MEIEVKNKFSIGDRIECVHPSGNFIAPVLRMENRKGEAVTVASGSGHRVWIDLPAQYTNSFVARFV
jgi:putative protease